MSRIFLGVFADTNEDLLLAAPVVAQGVRFTTTEHGYGLATGYVPARLVDAMQLYNRPGLPHVVLTWNGLRLFEGRLEDLTVDGGGWRFTAYGYWRALSDAPYSALWSATNLASWYRADERNVAGLAPKLYTMDNDNRLFIGLTKGTTYRNNTDHGCWAHIIPHNSERNFARWTGSYEVLVPTNWVMQLVRTSATNGEPWGAMGGGAVLQSVFGTGALLTGTFTLAPTQNTVLMWLVNASGANYTMAGESGTFYAKLTNVRLQSTASATVLASEIVAALVAYINAINPSQLSSSTARITSPGVDLNDEVYLDRTPADILDYLAALGNSATPPLRYEAAVWERRETVFQAKGASARMWYVDALDLTINRTVSTLVNAAYGLYRDPNAHSGPLRTAASSDADSVARFALTRRQAISAPTTSATQAAIHRDAAVNDGKSPPPYAAISFTRLYDAEGTRWPIFVARAGDIVVIRNLPPALSVIGDRFKSFGLAETDYDVDNNRIRVVPELPLPALDVLVARAAAGIGAHS